MEAEWLRGHGIACSFSNLSQIHGVPTVVTIVRGQAQGRPVRAIGSAADRTLSRAARRALGEATAAFSMCAQRVTAAPETEVTFTEFADNAYYYLDVRRMELIDQLDGCDAEDSSAPELLGDAVDVADEIAASLSARKIKVYLADVTPHWLDSTGIRVVISRSPDLYPLELGHGDPALARRLRRHVWRRALGDPTHLNLSPVPLA
jgi:hypothetical protein